MEDIDAFAAVNECIDIIALFISLLLRVQSLSPHDLLSFTMRSSVFDDRNMFNGLNYFSNTKIQVLT